MGLKWRRQVNGKNVRRQQTVEQYLILLLQNQDILSPPEQHWVSIKLSLKTLEDSPALIHQD